jgi:hypothetical protein
MSHRPRGGEESSGGCLGREPSLGEQAGDWGLGTRNTPGHVSTLSRIWFLRPSAGPRHTRGIVEWEDTACPPAHQLAGGKPEACGRRGHQREERLNPSPGRRSDGGALTGEIERVEHDFD